MSERLYLFSNLKRTGRCSCKPDHLRKALAAHPKCRLIWYLAKLEGKHLVKVVCMDLAAVYRALVRKHFPQARIVADGFHMIRIVNHHFLACWKELDPVG